MSDFFENSRDFGSLSDKVYTHLRDSITDGRYQTGDTLVETKIAEELGVSRTPVREALKQLELEDLVSSQPNRCVIVKAFSREDFADLFTIRHLLEGQAAYWAAERITDEQLSELSDRLDLMELYTRKKDIAKLMVLDSEFHGIIYEASRSRTIKHILLSLHKNISRARMSSYNNPDRPTASLDDHRAIFNALKAHDPTAAKLVMETHVTNASAAKLTETN